MLVISKRIYKNFAFDICGMYKIRNFSDGISLFNFKANIDLYKSNHNPKFEIQLIIFNVNILELNLYNINHIDGDKDEEDINSNPGNPII